MVSLMDISHFLQKYLLVALGEAASPSVDVVMGLVSVMVRVTGRTALGWGEGAKTGVKWPGTFPITWPLLLGYKTKKECPGEIIQNALILSNNSIQHTWTECTLWLMMDTHTSFSGVRYRVRWLVSSNKQQQHLKESFLLQSTLTQINSTSQHPWVTGRMILSFRESKVRDSSEYWKRQSKAKMKGLSLLVKIRNKCFSPCSSFSTMSLPKVSDYNFHVKDGITDKRMRRISRRSNSRISTLCNQDPLFCIQRF